MRKQRVERRPRRVGQPAGERPLCPFLLSTFSPLLSIGALPQLGPEGIEPSPARLKVCCAAFTPRPRFEISDLGLRISDFLRPLGCGAIRIPHPVNPAIRNLPRGCMAALLALLS